MGAKKPPPAAGNLENQNSPCMCKSKSKDQRFRKADGVKFQSESLSWMETQEEQMFEAESEARERPMCELRQVVVGDPVTRLSVYSGF